MKFQVEVFITEVRSAKTEVEADTRDAAIAHINQLNIWGELNWDEGDTTDVSYYVQPIITEDM